MEPSSFLLHLYFLERLAVSAAFAIPLLVALSSLRKGRSKEESSALSYVVLGFAIGFLGNILGGLAGAYLYRLPLLPLELRRAGLSASAIARTVFVYNTAFKVFYIASLFASLSLVGYGVYKMASIRDHATGTS